ncbi:hypothetical protein MRB53_041534 [Persea americana]|nr:hypothetical protein MRB53_041534 [Persea americana]
MWPRLGQRRGRRTCAEDGDERAGSVSRRGRGIVRQTQRGARRGLDEVRGSCSDTQRRGNDRAEPGSGGTPRGLRNGGNMRYASTRWLSCRCCIPIR